MPSKRSLKKKLAKAAGKPMTHTVAGENRYRIQTPGEREEVEWLLKDGTYRSVAHYEEIMTRQMAS